MSFQLSQDQVTALDGIENTLVKPQSDSPLFAVLTGSAGTGKTTVVSDLLDRIRADKFNREVYMCASTHRAAGVLEDATGEKVTTAHSLFKVKPSVNKFGKQILLRTNTEQFRTGSIVIIEESSMIGNDFLRAIVDIVKDYKLRVLFIGDPYQLPPPKDTCSIFDGSLPTFQLHTVHRQNKGNPILDKAIEFRDYIAGRRQQMPVISNAINAQGEGIHLLPHAEFVQAFVKKYMAYETGAVVDVPLCTFTNDSAINYNQMIRKAAYFLEDTIEPYYPGERLISNAVVMHLEKPILANNESVLVDRFHETTHHGIPGYQVHLFGEKSSFNQEGKKIVFAPRNKVSADTVLNALKKDAIKKKSSAVWAAFYEVKNSLADLRPPFAGTTHKAQGGTFPAVFIDQQNIAKCFDDAVRARLLYVALTRASRNAYVNV